jgi:IgGFc binding protein
MSTGIAGQDAACLREGVWTTYPPQMQDLTGSVIQATKPIGFMAGQPCMRYPVGVAYCDHGEQMVPPSRRWGTRTPK